MNEKNVPSGIHFGVLLKLRRRYDQDLKFGAAGLGATAVLWMFLLYEMFFDRSRSLWLFVPLIMAMVTRHLGWELFRRGRSGMNFIYERYCQRLLVPEARKLQRRIEELPIVVPRRNLFARAADLQKLEREYLDLLREKYSSMEYERKRVVWISENEKLWTEFERSLAGLGFLPDEVAAVKLVWKDLPLSSDRREQFRDHYINSILHRRFLEGLPKETRIVTTAADMEGPAHVMDFLRVSSLERLASTSTSTPEALLLYHQGKAAPDRRVKIRLFKRAIRADQDKMETYFSNLNHKIAAATPPPNETRALNLRDLLIHEFDIQSMVPGDVDPIMAKYIVLGLAKPSNRFRSWSSASRLFKWVRPKYEIEAGSQASRTAFDKALNWLGKIGVVTSEPGPGGTAYTLPRNTMGAQTEHAKEIIRKAISLKDELKRGKIW